MNFFYFYAYLFFFLIPVIQSSVVTVYAECHLKRIGPQAHNSFSC